LAVLQTPSPQAALVEDRVRAARPVLLGRLSRCPLPASPRECPREGGRSRRHGRALEGCGGRPGLFILEATTDRHGAWDDTWPW
jgi:hypothetical protein